MKNRQLTPAKPAVGFYLLLAAFVASTTNAQAAGNHFNSVLSSRHCGAFTSSHLFREPTKSTTADPSTWIQFIENAQNGEEILLEDGAYTIDRYALTITSGITLRSLSGNPESVVIKGNGYSEEAEALMIMANNVHIADLTIRDIKHHGISIQEGFSAPVIYNVNLIDIGSQHIKGNRPGPSGTIACSSLGYTEPVSKGDYNSAIDIHRAEDWTIRDNYIYNIYGDGSGCVIDTDCGSLWPGGEPAILLWQDSKNNTVERNTIIDSFRAIALGLSTPYSGGTVRNNFLCREEAGKDGVHGFISGDAGISLTGASDISIQNNVIYLQGDYPGDIEIQDGSGIIIENNELLKPVWDRGNTEYTDVDNTLNADFENISCREIGNSLHTSVAMQTVQLADHRDQTQGSGDGSKSLDKAIDELVTYVGQTYSDTTHELKALLMELQLERLKSAEDRLEVQKEQLKSKNERLKLQQQLLLNEERLHNLELQNSNILLKLDILHQQSLIK